MSYESPFKRIDIGTEPRVDDEAAVTTTSGYTSPIVRVDGGVGRNGFAVSPEVAAGQARVRALVDRMRGWGQCGYPASDLARQPNEVGVFDKYRVQILGMPHQLPDVRELPEDQLSGYPARVDHQAREAERVRTAPWLPALASTVKHLNLPELASGAAHAVGDFMKPREDVGKGVTSVQDDPGIAERAMNAALTVGAGGMGASSMAGVPKGSVGAFVGRLSPMWTESAEQGLTKLRQGAPAAEVYRDHRVGMDASTRAYYEVPQDIHVRDKLPPSAHTTGHRGVMADHYDLGPFADAYPDLAATPSKLRVVGKQDIAGYGPSVGFEVQVPNNRSVGRSINHEFEHYLAHKDGTMQGGSADNFISPIQERLKASTDPVERVKLKSLLNTLEANGRREALHAYSDLTGELRAFQNEKRVGMSEQWRNDHLPKWLDPAYHAEQIPMAGHEFERRATEAKAPKDFFQFYEDHVSPAIRRRY